MYIDRISLRNIKGFKELDFSLKRPDGTYAGWTVIVGDNGSGKSTLMRGIAMTLAGRDTVNKLQPNLNGWLRHESAKDDSWIQLLIARIEDDDGLKKGGRKPEKVFPARLAFSNGGKAVTVKAEKPPDTVKTYKTPERTIWSTDAQGWFSCGYGPFRRIFGASSEATEYMFGPLTARFATMFNEAASLRATDQWLRELAHKLRDEKPEGDMLPDVITLLNQGLLPNEIRVSRVDSEGLWLVDRQGVELDWGQMSDGYRSLLALLCDIIKQMHTSYGAVELLGKNEDGTVFVKCSGVVLIDEVDSHLHPEWQREVGRWFKQHFPLVQFIVSTHSPLVCQAADPNGLFKLPEPGSGEAPFPLTSEDYQKVISSRPDTILLTRAFGLVNTRSPEAVESRAKLAKLDRKRKSGASLTPEESALQTKLEFFVNEDEAP